MFINLIYINQYKLEQLLNIGKKLGLIEEQVFAFFDNCLLSPLCSLKMLNLKNRKMSVDCGW